MYLEQSSAGQEKNTDSKRTRTAINKKERTRTAINKKKKKIKRTRTAIKKEGKEHGQP
jgi:hypothetical protein